MKPLKNNTHGEMAISNNTRCQKSITSGHFGLSLGKTVYSILLQSTQLQNGYLA